MLRPIDPAYLLDVLQQLVRVDSVNPGLDPDGGGELEIAELTANLMADLGLTVRRHEPQPGRITVTGLRPGRDPRTGRSLMFNAHFDTVDVQTMAAPFSAEVKNGNLYGRGAYDMKASLAAALAAVKSLNDAGIELAGDLIVAGVADEETYSLGTADLIDCYAKEGYRLDGAVVTEPTQLQVCRAHKGFVWLEITVHGQAAHGSQYTLGVDANLKMGRVLSALAELEAKVRTREPHPLVGPPSLHAATLRGGSGMSTYAAESILGIERRTVPGETVEQVVGEVQDLLDQLQQADTEFSAELKVLFAREPFEVGEAAEIVRVLDTAVETVMGHKRKHVGENPWMDSALLAAAGVETVVFGPRGGGAHAAEEWVEVESVEVLAAVLGEVAVGYCGTVE